MKTPKVWKNRACVISVCFFVIALSQIAWCRAADAGPVIPGYLNPKTGAFRPLNVGTASDFETSAPPAPTTGKFVITLMVTVSSALPTNSAITCSANAFVFDDLNNSVSESATVTATRNGSTAKCVATIPYSWNLSSASQDHVVLDYTIDGGTGVSGLISRTTSQQIVSLKVPATGTTTRETVNATL